MIRTMRNEVCATLSRCLRGHVFNSRNLEHEQWAYKIIFDDRFLSAAAIVLAPVFFFAVAGLASSQCRGIQIAPLDVKIPGERRTLSPRACVAVCRARQCSQDHHPIIHFLGRTLRLAQTQARCAELRCFAHRMLLHSSRGVVALA